MKKSPANLDQKMRHGIVVRSPSRAKPAARFSESNYDYGKPILGNEQHEQPSPAGLGGRDGQTLPTGPGFVVRRLRTGIPPFMRPDGAERHVRQVERAKAARLFPGPVAS